MKFEIKTRCLITALNILLILGSLKANDIKPITLSALKSELKSANEGDTIFIKSGTYKDVKITLERKFKKKLTIKPEVDGEVKIIGKTTIVIKNSSNILLDGFTFEKCVNSSVLIIYGSSKIAISNSVFLSCGQNPFHRIIKIENGSSSNLICDNLFKDNRAIGITVMTTEDNPQDKKNLNNKILGNIFSEIKSVKDLYSMDNGMEAIQLGGGGRITENWKLFTRIENNLFERIIGDGVEIISNKSSNNFITSNIFLNNKSGITIRGGNNVLVYKNYFCSTSRGLRVFGENHKILNNVFFKGTVGIQMPASNIPFKDKDAIGNYSQQYNINIKGNVFKNVDSPIVINDRRNLNNRTLGPERIKLQGNTFVMSRNHEKEIINLSNQKNKINLIKNKTILSETLNPDNTDGLEIINCDLLLKSRSFGPNWLKH